MTAMLYDLGASPVSLAASLLLHPLIASVAAQIRTLKRDFMTAQ
jgi:hypothetical protein